MKWLLWNSRARSVLHSYWTSGGGPLGGASRLGTCLLEDFLEKGVRSRESLPIGCWEGRTLFFYSLNLELVAKSGSGLWKKSPKLKIVIPEVPDQDNGTKL
ncbi:hypothetical protein TNCV_3165001 [Trichonephila clavipes]|nr:hypothetical protein TNCV_3165001 [Trichonephila clavipes]